jgi:hypothetical protein
MIIKCVQEEYLKKYPSLEQNKEATWSRPEEVSALPAPPEVMALASHHVCISTLSSAGPVAPRRTVGREAGAGIPGYTGSHWAYWNG